LQGTGGLEATILDVGGTTQGVINDQFGNGVASVTGSTVSWFATRVGAYGPLPGTQAADITQLAAATAWRGRRIDPTGFYDLGARYYEPTSGRFLSADPMGQAASPSLYDFAGGDPVNFFDPDGRCPGGGGGSNPPTNPYPANGGSPTNGGQNPDDPNNGSQKPSPPIGGIIGQAMANGSQGMTLADYQALAAQLGLNGFSSNLSENQQLYYGETIANILQLQAQGKDVSKQWLQVVTDEVPGVIADSNGNVAGDSADRERTAFLLGVGALGTVIPAYLGDTLTRIAKGEGFPHRNDGSVFRNDEGLLPREAPDYYTEYVIPTPGNPGAGVQRVVVGQQGEVYYTPDHYATFVRVPVSGGGGDKRPVGP